jgi:hypothetical protein
VLFHPFSQSDKPLKKTEFSVVLANGSYVVVNSASFPDCTF